MSRIVLYDAWVYAEQLPSFFVWSAVPFLGEAMFSLWYKERPDDRIAMAFHNQRFVTQALVDEVETSLERPGTVAAALAAARRPWTS